LKGSVLGVITLYAVAAAAFSKDQLGVVEALESRLAQAFERSLGFSVEDHTAGAGKTIDTERAAASPVAL
jgi:hypothetical protein